MHMCDTQMYSRGLIVFFAFLGSRGNDHGNYGYRATTGFTLDASAPCAIPTVDVVQNASQTQ
jgi:hypothetical protein